MQKCEGIISVYERKMVMSFVDYIKQAEVTDDPRGDFIQDAKHDIASGRFRDARSWRELEGYLWSRHACPEAIEAAREVWTEYHPSNVESMTEAELDACLRPSSKNAPMTYERACEILDDWQRSRRREMKGRTCTD